MCQSGSSCTAAQTQPTLTWRPAPPGCGSTWRARRQRAGPPRCWRTVPARWGHGLPRAGWQAAGVPTAVQRRALTSARSEAAGQRACCMGLCRHYSPPSAQRCATRLLPSPAGGGPAAQLVRRLGLGPSRPRGRAAGHCLAPSAVQGARQARGRGLAGEPRGAGAAAAGHQGGVGAALREAPGGGRPLLRCSPEHCCLPVGNASKREDAARRSAPPPAHPLVAPALPPLPPCPQIPFIAQYRKEVCGELLAMRSSDEPQGLDLDGSGGFPRGTIRVSCVQRPAAHTVFASNMFRAGVGTLRGLECRRTQGVPL